MVGRRLASQAEGGFMSGDAQDSLSVRRDLFSLVHSYESMMK